MMSNFKTEFKIKAGKSEENEKIFFDDLEKYGDRTAVESGTEKLSYRQLDELARKVTGNTEGRGRALAFCICVNCPQSLAGYIGFLKRRIVPLLINSSVNRDLLERLKKIYRPDYVWCPDGFMEGEAEGEFGGWVMLRNHDSRPPEEGINPELAILLTTSGSTGSPKFVRQSYKNIQANTTSIVRYLGIKSTDRAITTMPMSYTYGLSIIQSHLMAGACIYMTGLTFFERDFWKLMKEKKITTFGAVPYTYQMLDRLRFLRMDLPDLEYITQAGGSLGRELHLKFAQGMRSQGKRLIVMYGASEATARMSYVPEEITVEKAGSIGIAIPGGRFELIDSDGSIISESGRVGELVYYGDNVTLGYACCREDLSKGDENHGRLVTGDMAMRDDDGCYFIVGRKKRFLKIFGNRVNLAETESLLMSEGYECACTGEDDCMRIYTTSDDMTGVINAAERLTHLNRSAFRAFHVETIPRNEAGKILYSSLN